MAGLWRCWLVGVLALGAAAMAPMPRRSFARQLGMMPRQRPLACVPAKRQHRLEIRRDQRLIRSLALQAQGQGSAYEWFNPTEKFELAEGPSHIDAPESAPLLLYIPGVDGSGLTPVAQFAELASRFEVRCLSFDRSDRSTFGEIVEIAKTAIAEAKQKGRSVYVMGESFGGIVGLFLGMQDQPETTPDRLILVNSASSFDRTFLGKVSPNLVKLPEPFFSLAVFPVGLLILDLDFFTYIAKAANNEYPPILQSKERQDFVARVYSKLLQAMFLKSEDLKWRVQNWVLPGCLEVNQRLKDVKVPVLAVAGTVDLLLPSEEEAKRFENEIPKCHVELIKGAGHAGALDQRTDLTSIIESWLTADSTSL